MNDLIDFQQVKNVFEGVVGLSPLAIDFDDLNSSFDEAIVDASLGSYGRDVLEAVFPLCATSIATEGYFEQAKKKKLQEKHQTMLLDSGSYSSFVRDYILNYVLIQGIATEEPYLVEKALEAGANPNARCRFNGVQMTAMVQASLVGNLETCTMLLNSGGNPNAKQTNGETALADAANRGHIQVCELLLEHGADPNQPTPLGTPLALAANMFTVKLLLDKGADPNIPDRDGDLPIIGFIDTGDVASVNLLKSAGTDLWRKNKQGEAAVDRAKRRSPLKIYPLLTEEAKQDSGLLSDSSRECSFCGASGPDNFRVGGYGSKTDRETGIRHTLLECKTCDISVDIEFALEKAQWTNAEDGRIVMKGLPDNPFLCPFCEGNFIEQSNQADISKNEYLEIGNCERCGSSASIIFKCES